MARLRANTKTAGGIPLRAAAFASLVVVAGGLWLVGCATATGGRKAEAERLDRELDEERSFAAPGAAPLARFSSEVERGTEEHAFRVMLREGHCYIVQAALSAGVREAQLNVFGPTGSRLAHSVQSAARLHIELCPPMSGPHRIVIDAVGKGPLKAAVYEKPAAPKPTAVKPGRRLPFRPSPTATATAPAATATPSATASAASGAAAGPMVCSAVGAATTFARLVKGEERACILDADCISVKTDCSHLACTGIHKSYRTQYAKPIDCRGYTGVVGNYDCDPQFGIEAPRCRSGCCVSERIVAFEKKP